MPERATEILTITVIICAENPWKDSALQSPRDLTLRIAALAVRAVGGSTAHLSRKGTCPQPTYLTEWKAMLAGGPVMRRSKFHTQLQGAVR